MSSLQEIINEQLALNEWLPIKLKNILNTVITTNITSQVATTNFTGLVLLV